jgi:poly(3-hydroxyoctanoate) depolymerase
VQRPPRRRTAPDDARVLRVDGTALRTSVRARGDGTPLLLLNGMGANLEMWRPFRDELDARTTIAFDAPGTGGSPPTWLPTTMAGLGRLAGALLDRLGIETVDVLGVSFGGGIAQHLAAQAPHRVRRLVLAATSYGLGSVPGNPLALAGMLTPLRYHSNTHGLFAPLVHGRSSAREPDAADAHERARFARPPHLVGYAWQLVAAGTWATLPSLRRIQAPTLVLAGDADPLIPLANARIIAAAMPDAELVVVRGGGHLVLFERARHTAAIVERFLDAP